MRGSTKSDFAASPHPCSQLAPKTSVSTSRTSTKKTFHQKRLKTGSQVTDSIDSCTQTSVRNELPPGALAYWLNGASKTGVSPPINGISLNAISIRTAAVAPAISFHTNTPRKVLTRVAP